MNQSTAMRFGLMIAGGVVVLLVLVALGLSVGPVAISPETMVNALFGGEMSWQRRVLVDIRLPRVVLAALGGIGLAVAGTIMQGLFRNPMADPSVIGVSGSSALGAVTFLWLGPVGSAIWGVPAAAFAFGVVGALVVYRLATQRGRTPVTTLLLAGIATSGIAAALTSFVLSMSLSDWEVGREMLSWLLGGLEGRSWTHVALAGPIVILGSARLFGYGRDLNVLATGEESALSVGIDVSRLKVTLLILTALVTAATVAVMGIVGFVGLIVPHVTRMLVGPDHRRLLPAAALVGGSYLILADILCRSLPQTDLRLGVVTALTGAPFFLFLLIKHRDRTGFS